MSSHSIDWNALERGVFELLTEGSAALRQLIAERVARFGIFGEIETGALHLCADCHEGAVAESIRDWSLFDFDEEKQLAANAALAGFAFSEEAGRGGTELRRFRIAVVGALRRYALEAALAVGPQLVYVDTGGLRLCGVDELESWHAFSAGR